MTKHCETCGKVLVDTLVHMVPVVRDSQILEFVPVCDDCRQWIGERYK